MRLHGTLFCSTETLVIFPSHQQMAVDECLMGSDTRFSVLGPRLGVGCCRICLPYAHRLPILLTGLGTLWTSCRTFLELCTEHDTRVLITSVTSSPGATANRSCWRCLFSAMLFIRNFSKWVFGSGR